MMSSASLICTVMLSRFCLFWIRRTIRAHPRSLDSRRGVCSEPLEHDADHSNANECCDGCCIAFEVAGQATIAADPGERPFDDPAFRQDYESGRVGSLHDL